MTSALNFLPSSKDSLIEIKSNLQGNNSRVDKAKNKINDMEQKEAKTNQSEKQREKKYFLNADSISSFGGNFKRSNVCIIGVPEAEEKEQEIRNLFEKIMKENSPYLVKEIDIQVEEAQRVPNR